MPRLIALLFLATTLGCESAPGPVPPAYECEVVPPAAFDPVLTEAPTWERGPRWVDERPAGSAFEVLVWLPGEVGAQPIYAVSEGTNIPFRLRFGVGEDDTTTAVTTVVLLEGRAVSVIHDGAMVSRIEVPLPLGHAVTSPITIPASELGSGLNRIDLLYFIHRNGAFRALIGSGFTVANGSAEGHAFAETPGLDNGVYEPGWQTRSYRTIAVAPELGETPFPLWTPTAGNLDNPTHVSIRLQANSPRSGCEPLEGNPDEMMLVAFRDMEPIPLGDVERVTVTIPRGEQRIFRFDFHPDFPEDEFHHYVIIQLAGFSRPVRRESGAGAPWATSRVVSEVFWGWHPPEE